MSGAQVSALIGHTGFVGSNLLRDGHYDATFNSASIAEISGRTFDTVVCAGVSAVKWWANQNPEEDLRRIEGLIGHLATIRAARFVLISTIDVYRDPVGVTEGDPPDPEGLHAYGRNRLMLESFVADKFSGHCIVRLPGLFGPGLKKNIIFDLMHDNQLELIDPDSRFQWYPVRRLEQDLARIQESGLKLINIATEPVATRVIQQRFFPGKAIGARAGAAAAYDMRTRYADVLGGSGPYHLATSIVLDDLALYLETEGARQ